MATGGVFTITELLQDGAFVPGGAARFEWTADLRSAPQKPWTIGTAVRNKRTDYPGGDEPTHQVLGPNSKDQQLEGKWDDRWNGTGYARATRRAFDDLVRRCNPVRVEFNGLSFVGLITDADYPYDYDGLIGYRFTISPQKAEEAAPLRSTDGVRAFSPSATLDQLNDLADRLSTLRDEAPTSALEGTVAGDIESVLAGVEQAFADINDTLNQRLLQPVEEGKIDILRVGAVFAQMRNSVGIALDALTGLRSDLDMGYQTAGDVLAFDAWTRETCFTLRLLSLGSTDAGDELAKRAQAGARALYRPHQGEHLYAISRKFYGTPSQWRMLAERNGLTSPIMTGDEMLVIPSAGGVTDRDGVGANTAGGGPAIPGSGDGVDSGGTTADGAGGGGILV